MARSRIPQAALAPVLGEPAAVVVDAQTDGRPLLSSRDLSGVGVAERVGQRLLGDR